MSFEDNQVYLQDNSQLLYTHQADADIWTNGEAKVTGLLSTLDSQMAETQKLMGMLSNMDYYDQANKILAKVKTLSYSPFMDVT